MSKKYTEYTMDEIKEYFISIGHVSTTHSTRPAVDPNIQYSKYDICYITTTKYNNKPDTIYERYDRFSEKFQWAAEILDEWGYSTYRNHDGFLDKGFRFIHSNEKLHSLLINANFFHSHLFQIKDAPDYNESYFTVKTKEDFRLKIDECMEHLIKRSGDPQLIREVKLKRLLDV